MYKLFFYLDKRIVEQKDAVLEILGFNDRFRAESIRHAMLVAYMYYPNATFSDVLSMSNISIDAVFGNAGADSKENFHRVCLRWPKKQVTSSLIDEVCKKAEVLNCTARSAYLLGLYLIGRGLLRGEVNLPKPSIGKLETEPKQIVMPQANNTKPESIQIASTVNAKPDVKTALAGLMKRKAT